MFHRHRYEMVAVNPGMHLDLTGLMVVYYYTRILYRCTECGRVKTRDVRGTWTLEDLRG